MEKRAIEIKMSKPYVKISGGWTGMRPVGRRRTYTAIIDGVTVENESKSEIQSVIRRKLHPVRPVFTFVDE